MNSMPIMKGYFTQVKHTTSCKPVVSTKCQNIKYQECKELPNETCEDQDMMVPSQEKEHKKKCLLPDSGSSGAGSVTPRGGKTDLVIFRPSQTGKQSKHLKIHLNWILDSRQKSYTRSM